MPFYMLIIKDIHSWHSMKDIIKCALHCVIMVKMSTWSLLIWSPDNLHIMFICEEPHRGELFFLELREIFDIVKWKIPRAFISVNIEPAIRIPVESRPHLKTMDMWRNVSMLAINYDVSGRKTEIGCLIKSAPFSFLMIFINDLGFHLAIFRSWFEIAADWIWLKITGYFVDIDYGSFLADRQIEHRSWVRADMSGILTCPLPLSCPSTIHQP